MSKNSPRIMVVEDERLLLEAIGMKMEVEGITPILCASGKEALDYLAENKERPNLIWLDYHLTDMDGLQFVNQIKKIKDLEDVPVIVVSNSASEEKVNAVLLSGAKKYILKAEHKLKDIILSAKELISS